MIFQKWVYSNNCLKVNRVKCVCQYKLELPGERKGVRERLNWTVKSVILINTWDPWWKYAGNNLKIEHCWNFLAASGNGEKVLVFYNGNACDVVNEKLPVTQAVEGPEVKAIVIPTGSSFLHYQLRAASCLTIITIYGSLLCWVTSLFGWKGSDRPRPIKGSFEHFVLSDQASVNSWITSCQLLFHLL